MAKKSGMTPVAETARTCRWEGEEWGYGGRRQEVRERDTGSARRARQCMAWQESWIHRAKHKVSDVVARVSVAMETTMLDGEELGLCKGI